MHLELKMPVYLVLCIDGDGLGETVSMFILNKETNVVIEAAVGVFKKLNPACNEKKVLCLTSILQNGKSLPTAFQVLL